MKVVNIIDTDYDFFVRDMRDYLSVKMQILTPKQREILMFRLYDNLTYQGIAKAIGKKSGCYIKRTISYSLNKLKRAICKDLKIRIECDKWGLYEHFCEIPRQKITI